MNGINIALGYGLASYMGMAFFFAKDPTTQWRGPLGIALVFPFMMLAILPFIPESPRYLLMQGKVDKARDVVLKLHSIPNDPDNEFARGEFYQMHKQAEFDRTSNVSWVRNSRCILSVFD
jgi:MFS family permease